MKKISIVIILILFPALCFTASALAADNNIATEQAKGLNLDALEGVLTGDAAELTGGLKVMESLDIDKGTSNLLSGIMSKLYGIVSSGIKNAVLIVLISLLCSVVSSGFGEGEYVTLAGVLAIAAVCVSGVNSFIGLGRQTLLELDTFSKMLLPTLTTAAISSGAVTSGAAKYAVTTLFLDVAITVSKTLIIPLIYAYCATSIAESAVGGEKLQGASGLIKWLAKTILSVMVIAFVAYLSLTGVITGASDAAAIRAAKFTISTVLPVVGGIISDASETVLAGASIIKNAVGVFGLFAVLGICAVPFLRLGVNYLAYKAASGVSGAVSDKRITKLVESIGTAFGLMLGVVGVTALMLFISIISVIRTAV